MASANNDFETAALHKQCFMLALQQPRAYESYLRAVETLQDVGTISNPNLRSRRLAQRDELVASVLQQCRVVCRTCATS